MTKSIHDNIAAALDPARSVVVEACAGSGKTWLLVSRVVRLLLAGVAPGEILAITYTRRAAQEMEARLREWLRVLALEPDETVREFLRERAVPETEIDALIAPSRHLLEDFLTATPGLSVNTFHGWFLQLLQRAPLDASEFSGTGGAALAEQTALLIEEAWQEFALSLQAEPQQMLATKLHYLFSHCGLGNTRRLLFNMLGKRAEWWVMTDGFADPIERLCAALRADLAVDPEHDYDQTLLGDANFLRELQEVLRAFGKGTEAKQKSAASMTAAIDAIGHAPPADIVAVLRAELLTKMLTPDKNMLKAALKLGVEAQCASVGERLLAAVQQGIEQAALRLNEAAIACGAAFTATYQRLKNERGAMDFTDVEWRVWKLLTRSDHALYMQYKLDARYRHVLLDEFQDTNPLQWQTLKAWLDAAISSGGAPTVFLVGDPKQSIYKFRRAEARLFDLAADFLETGLGAMRLTMLQSRRNAPEIIGAVNRVFGAEALFTGFAAHQAHDENLPGRVEILPLVGANFPSSGTEVFAQRTDEMGLSKFNSAIATPSPAGRERAGERVGAWKAAAYQPASPLPSPLPASGERGYEAEVLGVLNENSKFKTQNSNLILRNPLLQARVVEEDLRREQEARQIAQKIAGLVGRMTLTDRRGVTRVAEYRDIMLLVRRRTHLQIYERALREAGIPYLGSRQGGLLQTLEAGDLTALLQFLITPFADLQLAQTLRSPIFGCSDDDLMQLAQTAAASWWEGLASEAGGQVGADCIRPRATDNSVSKISPALHRAKNLLADWIAHADRLPVHDLLDRIYFQGEVLARYRAAVPMALCDAVEANLRAYLHLALALDSGRYPSLPRFIDELAMLQGTAGQEAPDEGQVSAADSEAEADGDTGNQLDRDIDALRVHTIHGAKGLEAPIVFLLDANNTTRRTDGYDALIDWPPHADRPTHFSLHTRQDERGQRRAALFASDAARGQREELNLLYVAMTRARQVLVVSGSENKANGGTESWYQKIARAVEGCRSGLARDDALNYHPIAGKPAPTGAPLATVLTAPSPLDFPVGEQKKQFSTPATLRGERLHLLLQWLTGPRRDITKNVLMGRVGVSGAEFESLWGAAQAILNAPALQDFFDPQHYLQAKNEVAYIDDTGEIKRIDRLVETADTVWVLDYKSGAASQNTSPDEPAIHLHRSQLNAYRLAMQAVYPHKRVRAGVILAGGVWREIEE